MFAVLALLPLMTLGVIQAQFLDFQHTWITRLHSGVLLADLVMVSCLWPRIRTLYVHRGRPRPVCSLVTMAAVAALFFIAGPLFPILLDAGDLNDHPYLARLGSHLEALHFLDVQNRRLYLGADGTTPDDACGDGTLALNLNRRSYRGANLSESVLCNAVLTDAHLQGAVLRDARLEGANLTNARLQGANLHGATLLRAQLQGAKFHGADLTHAHLEGVDFVGARLRDADLTRARLKEADLSGAQLQGALLEETDLVGARLLGAGLQGAMLLHARLADT